MNDATLFPGGLGEPVRPPPAPGGAPRVVGPVRTDPMLLACDLDTLLAPFRTGPARENTISQIPPYTATAPILRVG